MKNNLLLIALLFGALMMRAEATHLTIEPLTGAEQQYAVGQIGKITFADQVMYLFTKAGEPLGATPVSRIGKMIFGEGQEDPTALDEAGVTTVHVFPNPAQETLIVSGLQGDQTVRIYNMQGQMMQYAETHDGTAHLSVGGLQSGSYLLQVGAQVVKFIKE